jgi:hypothetical protein
VTIRRFGLAIHSSLGAGLTAFLLVIGSASQGYSQGILTQWNFQNGFSTTSPAPSSGTGTAALIGGTTGATAGGHLNGGSTDLTSTNVTGASQAWNITTFPAQSSGSGTAGVRFNVSTAGINDPLIVRFDHRASNTSSRFMRVEYTLNGGTSWTAAVTFDSNYGGDNWYNNRTIDLSGVSGVTNNANFGIRIVSIFDPANNTSYTATSTSSNYATNSTWWFDAVTFSTGHVWVGGSGTSLATPANYQANTPPTGTTNTILFGTAGGSNTSVTTATGASQFDQFIFQANAPSYTVSGSDSLILNAGLINNATNAQTISASSTTFGRSNAIHTVENSRLTFTTDVMFTNFLTLAGTHTGTTVRGGTVLFNGPVAGSLASDTSSNPARPTIRVTDGTTLGGTGTIGLNSNTVNVTVTTGGTLRAGNANGAGTLTLHTGTNGLSLQTNAKLGFRILDGSTPSSSNGGSTIGTLPNPTSNNYIQVLTGSLSWTPDNTLFVIDGTGTTFQLGQSYSYTVGQVVGQNLSSVNVTNQSQFSTVGFAAQDFALVGDSNGFLYVVFTPIPEPGTVLGIAAGVLGLGGVVRRRLRAKGQPVQV